MPRETWKELGGHSDGKIVKGAAFTALVEGISLPTHSGRKNGITNKTLTEIQNALFYFLTQIPCF